MVVKYLVAVLRLIYLNKRWNLAVTSAFDREQIEFPPRTPGTHRLYSCYTETMLGY